MTARRGEFALLFEGGRSRWATALFALSTVILLLHWGAIFAFVVPRLGELGFLRLHYTAALGVDWIGPWWMLFSFPVFGLVVLIVNTALARMLQTHDRTLGIVAHAGTAVTEAVLAFAGIAAVLLNG